MSDKIRRSMPLFPIGIVMQLTELSARQIRYYEENELIHPSRTEGNRRMFSFNDVDRLLEIRNYLEQGINLAGIKEIYRRKGKDSHQESEFEKPELTNSELRKILKNELFHAGKMNRSNLRAGEMSRFFH